MKHHRLPLPLSCTPWAAHEGSDLVHLALGGPAAVSDPAAGEIGVALRP